jgi:hypothetical protein
MRGSTITSVFVFCPTVPHLQIKSEKNAYLACDDIEQGIGNKIPLWIFGFLY